MVVTRKRNHSASETASSETPPAAKVKKQDEGDGGLPPGTTSRGAASSGVPFTITTRRTRRSNDPVAEAAPSRPSTPGAHHTTSDVKAQGREEAPQDGSSSDDVTEKVPPSGSRPKKLVVLLKSIGTPTPQSPRRRRVSGDEGDGHGTSRGTATVSTPVRRSRRLSGSGVEEVASQETPSKKSLSTVRKLGIMETSDEETPKKQSVLPVIKEDSEHPDNKHTDKESASKHTTEAPVLEEGEIEGREKLESAVPTTKEAETEHLESRLEHPECRQAEEASPSKDTEETQALKEGEMDGKEKLESAVSTNIEAESNNEDLTTIKDEVPSDPTSMKQITEKKTEIIPDKPLVADGDVLSNIKDDAPKNEDTEMKNSSEMTETENISTSNVTDNEGSNQMKTDEQENIPDSQEVGIESMEVSECNDSQEIKIESTVLIESDDNNRSTQSTVTYKESNALNATHVTSNTVSDENSSSEKISGLDTLPSTTESASKVAKVVPDVEKKIEQLRSIPKGLPVSGRWWKKEKQRFRSINKDATGKKSWSKKMQLKQWREDVQAKSASIEAEKQKKKEDLKERQRINKIRREENAKKSEVVQVIKDPRKIKKMKRKQLRYLETRDTTNLK